MKNNKSIYEINTRVWLKRFNSEIENPTLKNVPRDYWKKLFDYGINYIWLMGVWKTNESVIKDYCFEPGLVNEYKRVLKDFKTEDVIGSPYSIDSYELNPAIGSLEELLQLKEFLNSNGVKLILDFIPNHFSVHSSLTENNPDLFLSTTKDFYQRDDHTYFKSKFNEDKYFAHGRDPFFPAWQDTAQLNYFNPKTRKFMTNTLKRLTNLCDGVRVDMAMLALNNVFDNTWSGVLTKGEYEKPPVEFWKECIDEVKSLREDFLFIGEAYWDLEWELQRLGFDYTYDKKLLDRLKVGQISELQGHLMAEDSYQKKSVRFIENHDEERAIKAFGTDKSKAAAVIMSTIRGLKFYHDGQFEGKKIKLPVQLGREPIEKVNNSIIEFYDTLISVVESEVFEYGTWDFPEISPAWEGSNTYNNFLSWLVTYNDRKRLVLVNYSREVSQCRVKMDMTGYLEKFKLKDILNGKTYYRNTAEILAEGLFVELGPYKSHIFSY